LIFGDLAPFVKKEVKMPAGIVAAITAVANALVETFKFLTYWLNPKERARRRKAQYILQLKELEGRRDALFKKGATEGFTPAIDVAIAQVEKEIKDVKQKITLLGV
jgi:hypothetical protein